MLKIRQADISEIDALMKWRVEVLRHVFDIPQGEDMSGLYEANLEYYQRAVPNGEHIAVFAEISGAAVGCGGLCLYREMPSPDNPSGRCAYLMNIYTKEKYRGHGVGKAVAEYLINRAKARNITKIYLEATAEGRPMYESLGFRDMKDYMILKDTKEEQL